MVGGDGVQRTRVVRPVHEPHDDGPRLVEGGNPRVERCHDRRRGVVGPAARQRRVADAPRDRADLQPGPRRARLVAAAGSPVRGTPAPAGVDGPATVRADHGPDRVRPSSFLLPEHDASRARRGLLRARAGQGDRPRGVHRSRQVQHREAAHADVRPRRRDGRGQRRRRPRLRPRLLSAAARHRSAGSVRVQGHRRVEHPLCEPRRDRRRDAVGGASSGRARRCLPRFPEGSSTRSTRKVAISPGASDR